MDKEVIKEVNSSTPASADVKREICPINTSEIIIDGNSVPSYLRRKEKPVPLYRRASTGSCHDSCKFGTHHSPESKKDCPVRGWRQDRANARRRKEDQAEVIPRGRKAGNKDQTPKIFSHANDSSDSAQPGFTKQKLPLKVVPDHSEISPFVELPDEVSEPKCLIMSFDDRSNCGDGELSEGAVSIDLEMPLAIWDSDESDDHIMDVILPTEDVHEGVEQPLADHASGHWAIECVSSDKRNDQTVMAQEKNKHKTKSESSSREPVKSKTKATLTITRNTVSSHKTGVKSQRKAAGTSVECSDGPRTTAKKADVSATSKFNGKKKFHLVVASTLLKLKEIKVPSPASAENPSAKSTRLTKSKASTTKSAPAPSAPSGKQNGRKMTHENVARKDSQLSQNKGEEKATILSPLKLSRSINMSANCLSSTKMRAAKKETCASPMKNEKVYGTESSSDRKGKIVKTASPKIRKPDVNNKERQAHKEKAVIARTESAGRPKSLPISSSTVTQSPRRITFRRGKVLTNLARNPDNNTPKRVRFRPAKATDDSSIGKDLISGRITRKTGASASDASKGSGASRAEVVVLRRQDANEKKKSEQRSFNNVIEETASRLVEARKSKVKALVGAFETVISLQEKRGRSSSVSIS